MARPKEFDPDQALAAAIGTFAEHGFGGTSTDDLLRAMGISRQSLYDTFGDKRKLYLEALDRYCEGNVAQIVRAMNTASSPLVGIESALGLFASKAYATSSEGCLGVGAVCEFGRSDAEITAITDAHTRTLQSALERRLLDARALGELDPDLDLHDTARFLAMTLTGLQVGARGGASAAHLQGIVRVALRSLSPARPGAATGSPARRRRSAG